MKAIESSDPASPQGAVGILFRRKWLVIGTFLPILAIVTFVTLRMPKLYDTRMKILVNNEREDMVVSAAGGPPPGYKDAISEEQINTEIELLSSNTLLQQVAEKCGLEKREVVKGPPTGESRSVAIELAVTRLQKDLKISAVRKANVIEVDYESTDPHLAAVVLRQLAESYLEMHLRLHSSPGTYQFFADQSANYLKQVKDAEAKLAVFRDRDNIVMMNEQKDGMLKAEADSEAALLQADAAAGEYSNKISDTRRQLQALAPRVITQTKTVANLSSVEHLSSMLAELQNKRTELLTKFRPDDRLVQQVDQEIADTRVALDKSGKLTEAEQSTDNNPIRQALEMDFARETAELSGVEAKRKSLAQQTQVYRRKLTGLSDATAKFDDLTRSQREAEDNYVLYAKKAEEARISDSLDRQKIANVAIAEAPIEPHLPSKPNVSLNLALGGILASLLSIGSAFGAEYFKLPVTGVTVPAPALPAAKDDSVTFEMRHLPEALHHASDLENVTGLIVLAVVNRS